MIQAPGRCLSAGFFYGFSPAEVWLGWLTKHLQTKNLTTESIDTSNCW